MENTAKPVSILDKFEQISKIFGLIAVPIVVAVVGYFVQDKISSGNLNRDYVQIALGILKEKKQPDDAALRKWAVQLLNANSKEVKINDEIAKQLIEGVVKIPITYTTPSYSSSSYTAPSYSSNNYTSPEYVDSNYTSPTYSKK